MISPVIGGVNERFSTHRNKNEDLTSSETTTIEGLESALEQNIEDLQVFNPTNIRPLEGGPQNVIDAMEGETLEDFHIPTVAQFWYENGTVDVAFDADINPEDFDIKQDELRFDIDEWGSLSNRWTTYDSAEEAYPGIVPVKEAFPEAEVSGRLWFRKPQDSIDLYNEAIEYVGEGDADVHDDNALGEAIRQMSGEYPSTITNEDAKERIYQARAAIMSDVADKLGGTGVEFVSQEIGLEDEQEYDTYAELVSDMEEDEVDPVTVMLNHQDTGAELELTLWAEDDYTLSPEDGPGEAGYMIIADGEEGIRAVQDLYQRLG